MRLVSVAIAVLLGAPSALAEARHPTVQKVVEIAVANHVVRAECPKLSINPRLMALAVMAVGFAGRQVELDSIKEDEILALAETAKKTSQVTAADCDKLTGQSAPDPIDTTKTIPIFITAE